MGIIHNLRPEFLLLFQKQWEDSDVMLASTQETSLIKKVNSILIQAATSFHTKVKKPYFCQEHQHSVTAVKLGLMKDTPEVLQLYIHKN